MQTNENRERLKPLNLAIVRAAITVQCSEPELKGMIENHLANELITLFKQRQHEHDHCFAMKQDHPLQSLFTVATPDVIRLQADYYNLKHAPYIWSFKFNYKIMGDVAYVSMNCPADEYDVCVFKLKMTSKKQKRNFAQNENKLALSPP